MPPLLQWLPRYALPSLLAITATYAVLRLTQRSALRQPIAAEIDARSLRIGGKVAACGIFIAAIVLLTASFLDQPLGLPTCIAGAATAACVLLATRSAPWQVLRGISWGVLPLVAGLFVLVEALEKTGLIATLATLLREQVQQSASATAWGVGALLAVACNLMNNLPTGLIAGTAVQAAQAPQHVTGAVLIGVDLGPNLSVTGSLATILWLTALRRDGQGVSAWAFLKLGLLVMPPALLLALAGLMLPGIVAPIVRTWWS
jgi:arsenical pump membrane protein